MTLAHEIADAIVNENGYSDDPKESDLRDSERERLEVIIDKAIREELFAN